MGGYPKKPYGEKKIPVSFSVKRKYVLGFKNKCDELDLEPGNVIEQFLKSFLKNP